MFGRKPAADRSFPSRDEFRAYLLKRGRAAVVTPNMDGVNGGCCPVARCAHDAGFGIWVGRDQYSTAGNPVSMDRAIPGWAQSWIAWHDRLAHERGHVTAGECVDFLDGLP